jgi:spoIIIJ-associated protein
MTRRINAQGASIQAALTQALAELAGCDTDKVNVELDAPGLHADVDTRLRLEIEEPSKEPSEPSEQPSARRAAPEPTQEPATSGDGEDEEIDLDAEADAAADFIEGLLDVMGLPGDLKIRILEDHAEVEIVDVGSGALIGRRGQTLESIQELLRCALQREFQRRAHVQIDVEGYRARRLEKLIEKAEEAIDDVLDSGESERLEPMDVFERKAVHHLVAEYDGVVSRSQGREPARRVVIEPA